VSALLVFVVEGRPVSWQRTNVVKGRPMTDAKQREAKKRIALSAQAALRSRPWATDGDYAIQVDAYYPDRVFGDADRIPGLVMDALEGIAYRKDRQVSALDVRRHLDKARPRVEVRVYALDPGDDADAVMHGEAPLASRAAASAAIEAMSQQVEVPGETWLTDGQTWTREAAE
jgi:hypothetical protein